MVYSNYDTVIIAHSHEKLLYAEALINQYYILTTFEVEIWQVVT